MKTGLHPSLHPSLHPLSGEVCLRSSQHDWLSTVCGFGSQAGPKKKHTSKNACTTTRPRYITLKKAAMRTISKRTQYGLKAMLALGKRYGEGPVRMATIAAEESIPLKFLEIILLDLKGNGLLESKTGKRGGYLLSRPP